MERILAIPYDAALAEWGDAIKRGALASARRIQVDGAPPPALAIQRALADGDPSGG
jgi:hypothetical protein